MELVTEATRPAWWSVVGLTAVLIAGSELFVLGLHPPQAAANQMFWQMTRAAGFTAYGLLSTTVLLGLIGAGALGRLTRSRPWFSQLHSFTALLTLPFLTLHLYGLYRDQSVPFGPAALLLPFASAYRPRATALGVLSLYALAAILVTTWLSPRIPARVWRALHLLALPAFAGATLHGLLAGSDGASAWTHWVYAVPAALVALAAVLRTARWRG